MSVEAANMIGLFIFFFGAGVLIYRCGFVAGSIAADKYGLEEVKRRFKNKWRLTI